MNNDAAGVASTKRDQSTTPRTHSELFNFFSQCRSCQRVFHHGSNAVKNKNIKSIKIQSSYVVRLGLNLSQMSTMLFLLIMSSVALQRAAEAAHCDVPCAWEGSVIATREWKGRHVTNVCILMQPLNIFSFLLRLGQSSTPISLAP